MCTVYCTAGVVPTDVQALKPDFLIVAGYKWLLGPHGVSYAYVTDQWCTAGTPLEHSWLAREGSSDFSSILNCTGEFTRVGRVLHCLPWGEIARPLLHTATFEPESLGEY